MLTGHDSPGTVTRDAAAGVDRSTPGRAAMPSLTGTPDPTGGRRVRLQLELSVPTAALRPGAP